MALQFWRHHVCIMLKSPLFERCRGVLPAVTRKYAMFNHISIMIFVRRREHNCSVPASVRVTFRLAVPFSWRRG